MIEVTLTSAEARLLADSLAARLPAMREALADAITSEERVGFRAALDRAGSLHLKLTVAAAVNTHVLELGAGR